MSVPFIYVTQNLRMRRLTAAVTVAGIALVVFVFTAVLMMAYGVEKTLVDTGSKDNVIIVRKGSNQEMSSSVPGDVQGIIRALPHIKPAPDGTPIISTEPVVIINLAKNSGGMSNITVRGVSRTVTSLRTQMKIESGRMFNPALRELIVGKPIVERFSDAKIGSKIKFAGDLWEVVGTFTCQGGGYESEIWGDAEQLMSAFNRGNTASSMTVKLTDAGMFNQFKSAFNADVRLQQYDLDTESGYFSKQSEALAGFIKILGIFITVIFSIGATVGAMITMYGAVANRTVEIGTMRSLGFSRRSVLAVFLVESIAIALSGAVLGVLLASSLQFVKLSTLNFDSFSEIVFSFAMTPQIVIGSLLFGGLMGILGGFLPAVRAARMNIVNSLRAG